MKKNILLIIIGIIGFNGISQVNFEEAYFIDNQGKRIDCLIKNRGWDYNPTKFEYKIAEGSEVKVGNMQTISEFGIVGESKYKRVKLLIDRSSNNLNKLDISNKPKFTEETLFLKMLIGGDASLYLYQENSLVRFFYNVNGSEIKQLVYKRFRLDNGLIGKNNYFRQQLWRDLQCQDITLKKAENIDYFKKDLVDFFGTYNSCKDPNYVENQKVKINKGQFFLTLRPGVNLSRATIDENVRSRFVEVIDFSQKITGRVGLELEYVLPFNRNKWSLFIEPTYQFYNVKDIEEDFIPSIPNQNFNTATASINYSSLEIPLGIRYNFYLNDKNRIFINAAYMVDIVLDSRITLDLRDGSNFLDTKISSGDNFALGLGYNYNNRYSIELRFLTRRELLSNLNESESKYNTSSLIFGYTLF